MAGESRKGAARSLCLAHVVCLLPFLRMMACSRTLSSWPGWCRSRSRTQSWSSKTGRAAAKVLPKCHCNAPQWGASHAGYIPPVASAPISEPESHHSRRRVNNLPVSGALRACLSIGDIEGQWDGFRNDTEAAEALGSFTAPARDSGNREGGCEEKRNGGRFNFSCKARSSPLVNIRGSWLNAKLTCVGG